VPGQFWTFDQDAARPHPDAVTGGLGRRDVPGYPASASVPALARATEHLEPPYAVVDLDAFDRNAAALTRRAGGVPVRVASKSVRVRALLRRVLERPGFAGLLAFTLPEALWLAGDPALGADVLVAYPTVDRAALARLGADAAFASRVTLMVDDPAQLRLAAAALGPAAAPVRVCLDLDASLRLLGGRVHLGSRRSPVHDAAGLRDLARAVCDHPRFVLTGVMSYEGQLAGLADDVPGVRRFGVRAVQRASMARLREQRARAMAAVREVAPLELVNAGGTGSLEWSAADPSVTEVTAGSGLFAPTTFDHYRGFRHEPAAWFAVPVVRRPSSRHVTVLGGGWVASGPAGRDRLPTPVWPEGVRLLAAEGAGEVQTPLTGPGVRRLRVGDRVWFRHAKAGELSEHVDVVHLVAGGRVVGDAPTYRGECRAFA
jgi:D-serine deaminase-like pyridoxal phosphate-dependent protein